jgi:hypothetical protein
MNFWQEYNRSDAVISAYHIRRWMSNVSLFHYLWCVLWSLGESSICHVPLKLPLFFFCREVFLYYAGILFIIKLWPGFSIYLCFLPDAVITMIITNWWFSIILYITRLLQFVFTYKEVVICMDSWILHSMDYSSLSLLILMLNCSIFGQWRRPFKLVPVSL